MSSSISGLSSRLMTNRSAASSPIPTIPHAKKTDTVHFGANEQNKANATPSTWDRTKAAFSAAKSEIFSGPWKAGWKMGLALCILSSPLPGSQLFVFPGYMAVRRLYRGINAGREAFKAAQ